MAGLNTSNNENDQMLLNKLVVAKDEKLEELMARLVSETEGLEDGDKSLSEKNEMIVGIVFLITRLRFLIVDELSRLDFDINKKECDGVFTDSLKKKFGNRRAFLYNMNNRLNDIREDLNLVEKTFYYNNRY
jgi:hypothetical protein